jgi:hypothetical protein
VFCLSRNVTDEQPWYIHGKENRHVEAETCSSSIHDRAEGSHPVLAKDFKEFIRLTGMTHVRTSPYCPQSNGKLERSIAPSSPTAFDPVNQQPSKRPAT